jgi:hypothetical protein
MKGSFDKIMKSKPRRFSLLDLYRVFLGFAIIEGALVLWFFLRIRYSTKQFLIFNHSLQHLIIGAAILLAVGIFVFFLVDSLSSQKVLKNLEVRIETLLRIDISHPILKTSLIVIVLICGIASLFFYPLPYLQRLVFFIPNLDIFANLGERVGFLAIWIFLICIKVLILYSFSGRKASNALAIPVKLMVISWTVGIFFLGLFLLWSLVSKTFSLQAFLVPGMKILILSIWFSIWALLSRNKKWADRVFHTFVCLSIGLFYLLVCIQFAQWFDNWGPRHKDHFILLADAFLHGKLYLDPALLSGTHDLVFHNGHWYQSFPPFPALLMLPFIAISSLKVFNYTAFSIAAGACAVVVIYLIIDQLIRLGWSKLSRSGVVWLTALFAFGTVYWWLSVHVADGFLCQVVTVLACGLAFLSVLKRYPPWLAGAFLTMAILCRPNVFVLWPALLAITIQLNLVEEKVNWRQAFIWSAISAIPVILGMGCLLYYNHVRFGNFFDFGYATLNGSDFILENVQKYGVWNLHYAPFNLSSMFMFLPQLTARCKYYLPRGFGMSILLTTPAILYVARKFKINWWMGGCWASIILSIALLAMYSNNGANQYGYRYVMDFFIPVIMLIAWTAGQKVSWLLKTLILASILINYYGTISWFYSPC